MTARAFDRTRRIAGLFHGIVRVRRLQLLEDGFVRSRDPRVGHFLVCPAFANWRKLTNRSFPIPNKVNILATESDLRSPLCELLKWTLPYRGADGEVIYMLRLHRATNGQVVFTVSGQMNVENVAEVSELIKSEEAGRPIALDLRDLTLVDREAVRFLEHCDSHEIKLINCPPYVREWIARERDQRDLI